MVGIAEDSVQLRFTPDPPDVSCVVFGHLSPSGPSFREPIPTPEK